MYRLEKCAHNNFNEISFHPLSRTRFFANTVEKNIYVSFLQHTPTRVISPYNNTLEAVEKRVWWCVSRVVQRSFNAKLKEQLEYWSYEYRSDYTYILFLDRIKTKKGENADSGCTSEFWKQPKNGFTRFIIPLTVCVCIQWRIQKFRAHGKNSNVHRST